MKKTTKKSHSRASRKKMVRDLDLKRSKGGGPVGGTKGRADFSNLSIIKVLDKTSP